MQLIKRYDMFRWVESVEISKNKPKSLVADVSINPGNSLHDLRRTGRIFTVVDRGDPEADDFGTERIGNFDWIDRITQGLRHGTTLLIQRPAVCSDHAIGRGAFVAH